MMMNTDEIRAAVRNRDAGKVGWYAGFLVAEYQWTEDRMLSFFEELGCDRETVEQLIDEHNWNQELAADVREMGGF